MLTIAKHLLQKTIQRKRYKQKKKKNGGTDKKQGLYHPNGF